MKNLTFIEMLQEQWEQRKFVGIRFDTDYDQIPDCIRGQNIGIANRMYHFNKAIIDKTKDLVCMYSFNPVFYTGYYLEGIKALAKTLEYIEKIAPTVPIVISAMSRSINKEVEEYNRKYFDIIETFVDWKDIGAVRRNVGDMTLLYLANEASNEKLQQIIEGGLNSNGTGLILQYSEEILFVSDGLHFDVKARDKVVEMNTKIIEIKDKVLREKVM